MTLLTKSKGHLFFAGDFEYYQAGNEIFRAPKSNVIECGASPISGYRSGRFECYDNNVETLKRIVSDIAN